MMMLLTLLGLAACGSTPPPRTEGLNPLSISFLVMELDSPRDRPRIYNFWATWCGPCMAEMPALREFGKANPQVDIIFVNVDLPSLHDTKVPAVVKRMKLDAFEHLALDHKDPAYALNQVDGWPNSIPVTYVVSSRGERVKSFHTRVNHKMLAAAIDGLQ